jgi:hypothetical protein
LEFPKGIRANGIAAAAIQDAAVLAQPHWFMVQMRGFEII